MGGLRSGRSLLFQEHEGHAAGLRPIVATDDGLLVGIGAYHEMAEAQFAPFDQDGVVAEACVRLRYEQERL